MMRFTKALVALWASFGIVISAIALAVEPSSDWPAFFAGFAPAMLRIGLGLGIIWLVGWLFAWSFRNSA